MSARTVAAARRNAAVIAASGAAVTLLFLYPTSTNNGAGHGRPSQPAPPGVVGTPSPGVTRAALVVNGSVAGTRYGPVQVQLVMQGRRILRARAVVYPQGSGRDREINRSAIPTLDAEVVAAQSGQIDTVSGATYTSDGYRRSLQAALDAAAR